MSEFTRATQLALEVDIWEELEKHLKTGIKGVREVHFSYMSSPRLVIVHIRYDNGHKSTTVEWRGKQAEELMERLINRFNLVNSNVGDVNLKLIPGEVPVFNMEVYPYVDDESTLNTTKNRMNISTID